ncbi:rod shape-determining protein MreC [Elusimicrobiota bacterium]
MEETTTSRKSNLTFLLLIAISLFFVTAHLTGYICTVKRFLFYIVNPVPYIADTIIDSGYNVLENIKEIVSVHQENKDLRENIQKYVLVENDYKNVKEENKILRRIVKFADPRERKAVVARVINRESDSWFEWATINKGLKDGLFEDAPVLMLVGEKPVVLGRTWKVYDSFSQVILITNVLSSIPAKIKNLNEDGLIDGQNIDSVKIKYLLPDSRVDVGDEIVTSPISSIFPPNIRIGYISRLDKAQKHALRSAVVKVSAKLNSIREVVILIPEKQNNKSEQSE